MSQSAISDDRRPRRQTTREKILRAAAKAIRAKGPASVGVLEIMREAGLTHGGFYAHFKSKDELVAASISTMFEQGRDRFFARIAGKQGIEALRLWVDAYISPSHRDNPGGGCALAALSGDVARLDSAGHDAFDAGLRGIVARFTAYLPARDGFDAEAFAMAMLAEMAGAVALARAVGDRAMSDRILQSARDSLQARLTQVAA
jgi:TetR/AcrR family transcriptional repressor of nem operon